MDGDAQLVHVVEVLGAGGGLADFRTAGSKRPMRMAMMAITTSTSISVNAGRRLAGRGSMDRRSFA
jgi:hypothetical protein